MARITVEDCLEKVDNRFQLVLIAAKRTRQLEKGQMPLVDPDNDKFTVIALREIAEGLVTEKILDEPDAPEGPLIDFGDEPEQELAQADNQELDVQPAVAQQGSDQGESPAEDQQQDESPSDDVEHQDADQAVE